MGESNGPWYCDPVLEQFFKSKYGSLKLVDPDDERKKQVMTTHPYFVKLERRDRGQKSHEILEFMKWYNVDLPNEDHMKKWEIWYSWNVLYC